MRSLGYVEGHKGQAWKVRRLTQKVAGPLKFLKDPPSCHVDGLGGQE